MRKTKLKKYALSTAVVFCMSAALPVSAYAVELIPVGSAVGIEVDVDGVLVDEVSEVITDSGGVYPAKKAGVKIGDVIIGLNGTEIDDLEDFAEYAKSFDGTPVTLTILRQGKQLQCTVTPVLSVEGKYQVGLWLRDKVAGIGTVTYYNPQTGEYGALGHGINDPESGTLIPITEGKTYDASVVDVVQGKSGDPGELTGSFDTHAMFGTVGENTVYGIFGRCSGTPSTQQCAMETASIGEAVVGEAEILSTVDGSRPKNYSIHIDKIQRKDGEERYQITVTDPELLQRTGGVVCGMSGSPIIQNGKLIGAVTHVLVNDPTRGYGIFIDNMLEAA